MDQFNTQAWTGRSVEEVGCITPLMAAQIHATLGEGRAPQEGDPLPQLWHWCAFPPTADLEMLGPDGHPRGSDFLPPLRFPRRMWAGGALEFRAPLRVGDKITRRSVIRSVEEKEGSSGPMAFVKIDHMIFGPRGLAIQERQDLVYLDIPEVYTPPQKRPLHGDVVEVLTPSEPLLFRYSAITFNAHRIHYDKAYAQDVEKYRDLVVHGPLQASLLIRAAARLKGRLVQSFDFRGVHPMFVGRDMTISATTEDAGMRLTASQEGHACMLATATWMETV